MNAALKYSVVLNTLETTNATATPIPTPTTAAMAESENTPNTPPVMAPTAKLPQPNSSSGGRPHTTGTPRAANLLKVAASQCATSAVVPRRHLQAGLQAVARTVRRCAAVTAAMATSTRTNGCIGLPLARVVHRSALLLNGGTSCHRRAWLNPRSCPGVSAKVLAADQDLAHAAF